MLGMSAAQIALQGEKSSRTDRDRQIAFQAAEAALQDAEMDIEGSPDPAKSRSAIFKDKQVVSYFEAGCGAGESNQKLGLCEPSAAGTKAVWLAVDFTNETTNGARSVPFGKFTGQKMQVGVNSLPGKLPRYIIEVFVYTKEGQEANNESSSQSYFYRITAMGFGVNGSTQVVLQTFYKKYEKS